MKWLMRKCIKCGKYTLARDKCPFCGGKLYVPHPPRFSPEDKYVSLRVRMKLENKLIDLDEKPFYFID
ncbi:MAG: ribosome biogenesis protein [Desulfurococcales archaeon ex4484_58]|nr:MAG: ribosome biogenesis protein [Desulfurococcales archaeon ex4484_58]